MKFAISAVVMLALAMGVQSSLIGGLPALGLGLGHGYAAAIAHPGPVLAHGPLLGAHGLGLSPLLPAIPALPAAHIPAAVAIAPHAAHIAAPVHAAAIAPIPLHGATYVAKTRGAVHTAPLPGHIQSAASVNVAPAPGTW